MRVNFGTGLVVGVLFASLLVVASGGAHAPSVFGPALQTAGNVQYTSAETATTTMSSTTASSTLGVPNALSNLSSSATSITEAATAQAGAGFSMASSVQLPSRLAAIEGNPSQVPFLLLPVALAVALGLALYLGSKPAD